MFSFTQIFIVCSMLFANVNAAIEPEGLGQQLIGGFEKMKEIANTCLDDLPIHAGNDTLGKEFQQCVKSMVFQCVDKILNSTAIEIGIGSGVELVKDGNSTSSENDSGREATALMSWQSLLMDRAEKVFQTHVVRINLAKSRELFSNGGRGAKHSIKLLFPLMVVIFMKMSAFIVPLGFQFMAMIGGKALLLSKMALLMASVQGLKGVGWPSYGAHHQGHHHTGSAPHTDHHYSSGYGKSS